MVINAGGTQTSHGLNLDTNVITPMGLSVKIEKR